MSLSPAAIASTPHGRAMHLDASDGAVVRMKWRKFVFVSVSVRLSGRGGALQLKATCMKI
jgi:hypothetical protein